MSWLRRIRNTIWPSRIERDIDRELSFHLAERIDQLQSEGLSRDEAHRQARRQFGNVLVQSERTRDMDISLAIDARVRDLRYAIRTLRRTPGFTLTAVLTLALGIGANASMFSALDAVLLQPLAFPESHQLMRLRQARQTTAESAIAPIRLEDWHRMNSTFDTLTGYYMEDVSETSGDVAQRVRRALVAPRFLDVWRIAPALGRGFATEHHRVGGPAAVLISHRYWQTRLGGDPNVLDRSVRIGTASFPIVGVMPATFLFPERDVDLWFPVAIDNQFAQSRKNTWYTVVGRLKAAVTLTEGRADLQTVQAQLAQEYPDTDAGIAVEVVPLKEQTVAGARASLWLLFGAVSVLLLITCVNIAALLLSRATHRQQEVTLRLSLGATRSAVVAQLLTETTILALAGGAIGIGIAVVAAAGFRNAAPNLPRVDEIALNGRVLAYTVVSSIIVAFLCALLPAIRAGRDGLIGGIRDGSRTQVSGKNSLQWTLVGVQVALSVTLLVGAGLLARSLRELSRVEAGFDASHVLSFRISGNYGETTNYDRLNRRIDTAIAELGSLPGVESAATTMAAPGLPFQFETPLQLAEAPEPTETRLVAESRVASPEYFATVKIPVVDGELCRRPATGGSREIMINRTFLARYLSAWPSPIGLHLKNGDGTAEFGRIVGVVGDAREQGLDRAVAPTVYRCLSAPNPTPLFLIRTIGDPAAMAQSIRLTVKELEPMRSVYEMEQLAERIDGAFAQNRLRTGVLVAFALSALLLACVGLYGTLSYVVSLRRREIGLRFALGAARGAILRQFLGRVLSVVLIGCAGGLALSIAFSRWLSGMLFGVSPSDPLTIAAVAVMVLVVAMLAAAGPAARAAMFDPMQVLRDE